MSNSPWDFDAGKAKKEEHIKIIQRFKNFFQNFFAKKTRTESTGVNKANVKKTLSIHDSVIAGIFIVGLAYASNSTYKSFKMYEQEKLKLDTVQQLYKQSVDLGSLAKLTISSTQKETLNAEDIRSYLDSILGIKQNARVIAKNNGIEGLESSRNLDNTIEAVTQLLNKTTDGSINKIFMLQGVLEINRAENTFIKGYLIEKNIILPRENEQLLTSNEDKEVAFK